MTIFISYIILSICLFHFFVSIYNRYLLCITDSRWKVPLHYASFIFLVPVPIALLLLFHNASPVNQALSWRPKSVAAFCIFVPYVGLLAYWATRSVSWIQNRFFPVEPRNLIEETVYEPIVPKVNSRLPRGLTSFETTSDLQLVERDIALNGLSPLFDGLKIAQVSDVHFSQRPEMENYLEGVVRLVDQLNADIVVLTGDLVDRRRDISRSLDYHRRFRGTLGTLCVLGNHDYWTNPDRIIQELDRSHIYWLGGGERRTLKRQGRRLIFSGTDSPWDQQDIDWKRLIRREVGDAVVFLSHTPDNADRAANEGASLILSGHNHGGQICLPGFGPVIVPSRHGLKYAGGCYHVGVDSTLNVSRGIGSSSGKVRVLCPPEVCLITLRAPVVEVQAGNIIPATSIIKSKEAPEPASGQIMAKQKFQQSE